MATSVLMSVQDVAQAQTGYSLAIPFHRSAGTVGIELITTAGSITVTQQCSVNYNPENASAATWYDPVDAAASALGTVATACAVTTGKYISYSPVFAPYIRYKVVEQNSAATKVSLKLVQKEER